MRPIYTERIIKQVDTAPYGKVIMDITNVMYDNNMPWNLAFSKYIDDNNLDDDTIDNIDRVYEFDSIMKPDEQCYYHEPFYKEYINPDEESIPAKHVIYYINQCKCDNEDIPYENIVLDVCDELNIPYKNFIKGYKLLKEALSTSNDIADIRIPKRILKSHEYYLLDEFNEKFCMEFMNNNCDIIEKARRWKAFKNTHN